MKPEWEAERALSRAEAAALISAQFPGLSGRPVELLAIGWDNTVFVLDDEWVFRFPRRAIAVPGLEREAEMLPQLAEHLPLPIPVPELVGHPSTGYPWPFWGARLILGQELADTTPPENGWVDAAAEAGAFLRALHEPRLVVELGKGLARDPWHRGDPSVRVPLARERLARLELHDPATDALLGEAEGLGPAEGDVVVSHGDLHMRHLLVDPDGRATGVIDWGDLCLAAPAVDLSLGYGAFSGPARTAFLTSYGPVGLEQEIRARVLAVFLCATLAEYAASTGHDRLRHEALAGLRRAVE